MALDNIEDLLKKYVDAKTTIKEETRLRQFFSQDIIPSHLADYKALFNYFESKKSERFTKDLPIKSRKINWKRLSVAASVAVLIAFYVIDTNTQKKLTNKQVKQEFRITQNALNRISKNLQQGNLAIAQLDEFEITKNKVFK